MDMRLLLLQLQVSAAVLVILILRVGMRKLPKIYSYGLWLLVFARLLCPIQLESSVSFMPSMSESTIWLEQTLVRIVGGEQGDLEGGGMSSGQTDSIVPGMQPDNAPGNQSGTGDTAWNVPGQFPEDGTNKNSTEDEGVFGDHSPGMGDVTNGMDIDTGADNDVNLSIGPTSDITVPADEGSSAARPTGTEWSIGTDPEALSAVIALPASLSRALYLLWALGTFGILLYNGTILIKVKRRLQGARHVNENVYISENIKTPFTLGLLKPRIFLPSGLQEAEREYILCHERVHIKRKDDLIKNLAFLLTAVYWFNPFVWVAFCFLERDMEMACDEKVLRLMGTGIKRQYSQSLLNFAGGRDGMAVTPFAFGENGVKQRVKNVLSYSKTKVWSIVVGILILLTAAVVLFTVRTEDGTLLERLERYFGVTMITENAGEDGQISQEQLPGSEPGNGNLGNGNSEITEDKDIAQRVKAAQADARMALELWASAFVERDGETLRLLSYDKEAFAAWDLVNMQGEELVSFGYANPWPLPDSSGYSITWQDDEDTARIRYYVTNSLSEINIPTIFVEDESVRIIWEEDLCYIDHEQMIAYDRIENREQFEKLYGQGTYNFSYENTGYTADYYRAMIRHVSKAKYLKDDQFSDNHYGIFEYPEPETDFRLLSPNPRIFPDGWVKSLLHLGAGKSSVEYDGVLMTVEDWDADWLREMSWMGEGSMAYVTYTFQSDGSQVVIPMELIEGSAGIWAPAESGFIRQVYQTHSGDPYGLGAEGEVFVQTSQYGIYLLDRQGLHCVYPYYVPEDVCWTIDDWKLYFDVDSLYQERYPDYQSDSICVLDLRTGEFDREAIPLPAGKPQWLYVYGGFIHLQYGNRQYHEPLLNTEDGPLRKEVWNGKTAAELTEEEADAYAEAVRRQLLESPGTLLDLSNRTLEETFALVDLDGDGHAERVCLSADPSRQSHYDWPYDAWRFTLNHNEITGWSSILYNNIWAVSLDGEEILLAIYEDGPSADPRTTLFRAADGQLQMVGSFPADITVCTIEEGVITGLARIDVIQTDRAYYRWRISDTGELERAPKEYYEFQALNDVELLVELPVYDAPGGQESHLMQPQTVKMIMTDESMQWVYLEGETGDSGWFLMGDHFTIADLQVDYYEVFEGLQFAD